MIVKLDEDLPSSLARPLELRGHVARTVRDQGWSGLKDSQLWPLVAEEQAFFITGDKGFGDLRAYPPGSHHGVLVLRPVVESAPSFRTLLESVLEKQALASLAGAVTVATPGRVRIRRKV
jgi:predicted nuclease of predicted toxin-antitoxin system